MRGKCPMAFSNEFPEYGGVFPPVAVDEEAGSVSMAKWKYPLAAG